VRTEVEVVARAGPGGRTVLAALHGTGAMAPRRTGTHRVHLVATAAGPLNGDDVRIAVRVGAGARLELRSVAATLALPGRAAGGPSRVLLDAVVEDGATLDLALRPTVVAAGADVHAVTVLAVAAGARLDLTETVVLGRHREAAGRWRGDLVAELGGRPWVRQSLGLGPASPAWDALSAPRAFVTRLRTGPVEHADATCGTAVRAPLARGGTLVTAAAADLAAAERDAAALDGERFGLATPRRATPARRTRA
jgi:urease accessory protein